MNNEMIASKEENKNIDKVINLLEGVTNELKDKRDYENRDKSAPIEVDTYKYTRLEIKNIDKEYKKHNVKFVSNIIISSALAIGMGVMIFNNPEAVKSMDLGTMIDSLNNFITSIPLYKNLDLSFLKEYAEKITPGLLVTAGMGMGIVSRITSSIKEKLKIDKERKSLEEKMQYFIAEHPELEEEVTSLLSRSEEKAK